MTRLAARAGLDRLAANLSDCSRTLALDEAGRVVGRFACRERWCPTCQAARSATWAARLHAAMPAIVAERGGEWAFLLVTLTVRSMPLAQLRDGLRDLHDAVDRMARRAAFAAQGWVRCTEVTVRADGMAHPHVHLLLAVPRSYFAGPLRTERTERGQRRIVAGYMRHDQWRDLWAECARLDYSPVVDVRRVRGDLTKPAGRRALYEVTKYGCKPSDLLRLDPAHFATLAAQMRGVRSIGLGKALRAYLEEPEDDGDGPEALPPDVADVATWDATARRYLPADAKTVVSMQDERAARRALLTPLGRALAARAARRGGMGAADYEAVQAAVQARTPPRPTQPPADPASDRPPAPASAPEGAAREC